MTIVADQKCLVSVEKMYQELLLFSKISHWKHIKTVTIEERYLCKLDNSTQISFCSPDQVVLLNDIDKSSGVWVTGIDFETGLKLLEPYMRKLKIKKLKKKLL